MCTERMVSRCSSAEGWRVNGLEANARTAHAAQREVADLGPRLKLK